MSTNEYLLQIRNVADHPPSAWSPDKRRAFLEACETYIGELRRAGQLIAAQPLERSGVILARRDGGFTESPVAGTPDLQVGYYHVRAASLADAIAIARRNPEFAYSDTARIEVRPVRTREPDTGFEYPRGQ